MAERIPDEALVVRGGKCKPESFKANMRKPHPTGLIGASVQSDAGVPLEGLARFLPQSEIGMTTVGAIRQAGGDVIRTSGVGYHATVTGLTPSQLSQLFTPALPNPAKRTKGGTP
jgi:hypothetical protein